MRVTITGATGLVGRALVAALQARGDEVTVLSRDPARAQKLLGASAVGWDPPAEAAPSQALAGRAAFVNLAGENIAQRWTAAAKRAIRDSRVLGTRNLLDGLRAADVGAEAVLVSGSAIGYYGPHGDEPLDEDTPAGRDFLAATCAAWEAESQPAQDLGLRVVNIRTGVVLDPRGGALAKMLPPFRMGLGGPVSGGRQYVSWIHPEDLVGLILGALDESSWTGAVNATAPDPVRNGELSQALARALRRPALLPIPGLALRALYGEMASIVTTGARVMPAKALVLGHRFRHPELDAALEQLLG